MSPPLFNFVQHTDSMPARNSSDFVEVGNLRYQAQVTIPDFWSAGPAVLVAQIPYLVGVS